jgi:hypothetical protein
MSPLMAAEPEPNNMNKPSTLPFFFSTVQIPSVARWAFDKINEHQPHSLVVDGRKVNVRCWMFEGKMPHRPEAFNAQWNLIEGRQYVCRVSNHGGQYRGQKATTLISFTEFSSVDGLPLPA